MSYVITMGGQKGGVGKTSLAVALVEEYIERGLWACVLDADPQESALSWASNAEREGTDPKRTAPVFAVKPAELQERVRSLGRRYDVIVIDTPGTQPSEQRQAVECADLVLLPSPPSPIELRALYRGDLWVSQLREQHPHLAAAIVLNCVDMRLSASRVAMKALAEARLPVLATQVRDRADHQYAYSAGIGVTRYAPRSEAAADVRALADELFVRASGAIPGVMAFGDNGAAVSL